ncbi:3'-5' exonuclease [Rhinocladiella similis]
MDLAGLSSNWKKLQATLKKPDVARSSSKPANQNGLKRQREQSKATITKPSLLPRKKLRMTTTMAQGRTTAKAIVPIQELEMSESDARQRPADRAFSDKVNAGLSKSAEVGKYVAIDCEMVGVGPHPDRESALARVSIVNYNGEQVYDSYVLPQETVTDWRTFVSGVEPKHMKHARSFQEAQADVAKIMQGRVLVGHHISHDLNALKLSHPQRDIRDTARHAPYKRIHGGSGYPRLKMLASELLGFEIQEGEHSSIEDARACMLLFRRDKTAFERDHAKRWPTKPAPPPKPLDDPENQEQASKPKKKKKKKKSKR